MADILRRSRSACRTDPGHVRKNNEDLVYSDDERGIHIVIDGMGGEAAGEEAARIALDRVRGRLERPAGSVEQRIREAITLANNAIYETAQKHEHWRGMACVLTLVVIDGTKATAGHVGDSRLYKIRGSQIRKLTQDHSPVGEREDAGELTEEQAMRHPRRNEVYRDVGSELHQPDDDHFIDILEVDFEPDSALLLCSDGLTDVVPSRQILRAVEENAGDPNRTVRRLIELANKESKDNVSVVLIEGPDFAASLQSSASSAKIAAPKRRAKIQDPEATVTLPSARHAPDRVPSSRRGKSSWAYLAAGLVAGAGLATGVLYFNAAAPATADPPRRITVSASTEGGIAGALAAAKDGDTVEVLPGEYRERIRLKDGVDLIARNPGAAILRAPEGPEPVVVARNIRKARLAGLRIVGEASSPDIGIAVQDSNLQLERLEISGMASAAIDFAGGSEGSLFGGYLHHNPGRAVIFRDTSSVEVQNNILASNGKQPENLLPHVQILNAAHPVLRANVFVDSGAEAIWAVEKIDGGLRAANFFIPGNGKPVKPHIRIMPPMELLR